MKKVLTSGGKAVLVGGKAMVGSVTNAPVQESDINFYDYDGTLLHAWSLAELQGKTELPELPTQPGLVCQGWNWTLAELKSQNSEMDVGAMYITDDGDTRIYVRLTALHKALALNLAMNGTATVDWGDGSEPDTLTGTGGAAVKTPLHEYAAAGDYMISITVTGSAWIPGTSSGLSSTLLYETADTIGAAPKLVKKIEIGANVLFWDYALGQMSLMDKISIPSHIRTTVYTFNRCESLRFVTIPHGETTIAIAAMAFMEAMTGVSFPGTLTAIGVSAILETGVFKRLLLPKAISSLPGNGLSSLYYVQEFKAFGPLTSIADQAFRLWKNCVSYDFTACTAVPTLGTNVFNDINAACEIRVPAALLSEWKAATNWATYADHIVGV